MNKLDGNKTYIAAGVAIVMAVGKLINMKYKFIQIDEATANTIVCSVLGLAAFLARSGAKKDVKKSKED